jgi:hypothetical protein
MIDRERGIPWMGGANPHVRRWERERLQNFRDFYGGDVEPERTSISLHAWAFKRDFADCAENTKSGRFENFKCDVPNDPAQRERYLQAFPNYLLEDITGTTSTFDADTGEYRENDPGRDIEHPQASPSRREGSRSPGPPEAGEQDATTYRSRTPLSQYRTPRALVCPRP